jgi:tRNA A-37 threonylcarbamoyl transferase component Bud32
VGIDVTRRFAAAVVVVALSTIYLVLQVGCVRPHLWPAGEGARTGGESAAIMLGRPPTLNADSPAFVEVVPGSAADVAGLREGDILLERIDVLTGKGIDLRNFAAADTGNRLRLWRDIYRMGVRDPLRLVVRRPSEGRELSLEVARPAAWRLGPDAFALWMKVHISDLLQMVVFIALSAVMLALRASDPAAALAVLALTLCAVAAGGPPLGGEYLLPRPLQLPVTLFSWVATPMAFIATSFAIGYFPRKAAALVRRPWLLALPFIVTAPMLVLTASSALFLVGVDDALPVVAWDATNRWLFYMSFASAIAMNIGVVAEAVGRFQSNQDVNERRRIAISVATIVPGVLAFSIKEGVPGVGQLLGQDWTLPWWLMLALQIVILLPAFGLTYAVAVHRVFAPATVIRRSVQYALARKTLAVLAMLPAIALIASFVKNRDMTIGMLVSGRPLFYLLTTAALIAAIRYRDAERRWLDRRFFREAYDAREILLSLASRVTYETDPNELTAMVADRIETALHPEMVAVLVNGIDEGQLRPISVLRGSAPPLANDSGLATMLQWSPEPLELYVGDERSPARRLPPADQEWLKATGAVLFVPVMSRGSGTSTPQSTLIALIALGARRSEEPYTTEDRQLLASIAAQMALALDVARLRQRPADAAGPGLSECPQCGRCGAHGTARCPADGVAMHAVPAVPHVIENKYRIDRVVGRGGMGAVYQARDMRLDRDVAIKVVRADLLDAAEARSRFRREAQIVARLQHPGIVSVFDYGTFADGSAFLVMELVRGEDLRRVLQRDGAMPISRALPIVGAMCAAVHAAHRDGVLHRDLKPENILLVHGDLPVKVLDFGVAKLVTDRATDETSLGGLTRAGSILGTPAYMAPEQLRSEAVDARTDIFSLGVIAYEMLTGELPFGRASLWEIGEQQARGMKPMQTPSDPVPPYVEQAVRRALSTDPAGRPATAADFASLLTVSTAL